MNRATKQTCQEKDSSGTFLTALYKVTAFVICSPSILAAVMSMLISLKCLLIVVLWRPYFQQR
jgi:hypothetical protein